MATSSAIASWKLAGTSLGSLRVLMPVTAVLFTSCAYWILKSPSDFHNLTKIIFIVALTLVVLPLTRIAAYKFDSGIKETDLHCMNKSPADVSGSDPSRVPQEPDIYYIILDRYASEDALMRYYGFDNSAFTGRLRDIGFYVASESRSNYLVTAQSLASSLNMAYINCLTELVGENSDNWLPLFRLLEDHAVWRFLETRGYEFVHMGTRWNPTSKNKHADLNVNYFQLPEFAMLLCQTTIAYPVLSKLRILDMRMEKWKRINHQFDTLTRLPDSEKPRFVFAHFLLPHGPFVFDANGRFLEPAEVTHKARNEKYLAQLEYANKRIVEVVEHLMSSSPQPPVIVVQADEGPYPEETVPKDFKWTDATTDQLTLKSSILNAYYLPPGGGDMLYPSITPVNTFRVIFDAYFGTDFGLLPDESYGYVDLKHLYEFFPITEKTH